MPDIKDSVGEGGANQPHDVALVQAMLRIVRDKHNRPYLQGHYDGAYGKITKNAIIAFQQDHNLVVPPTPLPPALPGPTPSATPILPLPSALAGAIGAAAGALAAGIGALFQEKLGLVRVGAATIQKLTAMLPSESTDIRIIEGTRTVYWPGSFFDAFAEEQRIAGDPNLEPNFRAVVADLVRLMFERHRIVLTVTPSGGRRTFQKQYQLLTETTSTQAGPGESNHNFGQAVDIGFKGLKWMRGNGAAGPPSGDDWWLQGLAAASSAKANEMWAARNKIAFDELKLFKSNLKGDLIHVQKFSDDNVSMRRSLADLLTRAGAMKWEHSGQYKCDLGGGGALFAVGTAAAVWKGQASVTAAEIAGATGVPASTIKAADVAAMRQKLKADMEAAEANWTLWQAKEKT
jgi:hypothetical protein